MNGAPRAQDEFGALRAVTVPAWSRIPGLVHGFLSRRGGVSRGGHATLNLSERVGDDPADVRENWRRVSHAVGGVGFATARQVHGCRVLEAKSPGRDVGEADALVTETDGIAVGILTADCVPLLLVAPEHHLAMAVHAGWRGTVAGIAAHAVRFLEARYQVPPGALLVALGPAIGACCYEVDADIGKRLHRDWGPLPEKAVRSGDREPAKAFVDLRAANEHILIRNGVDSGRIAVVGPCTRCANDTYFSHRGSPTTGRQLSFVGWQK